jgi:hypothetical protein
VPAANNTTVLPQRCFTLPMREPVPYATPVTCQHSSTHVLPRRKPPPHHRSHTCPRRNLHRTTTHHSQLRRAAPSSARLAANPSLPCRHTDRHDTHRVATMLDCSLPAPLQHRHARAYELNASTMATVCKQSHPSVTARRRPSSTAAQHAAHPAVARCQQLPSPLLH